MLVHSIASLALLAGFTQPVAPLPTTPGVKAEQPTTAKAVDPAAPDTTGTPRVEVVFVLDTTGSMGGLIDGAQKKIWAIANAIATCKPAPKLKVGLVAYRDRGDEYITKVVPLTDDLDAIYTKLMAFRADGGGDGPESVNQALNDAVTKIDWTPVSEGAQSNTLRIVYLVGDAPPHMDYPDDVKHTESCLLAMKKGLIINSIQCGDAGDTANVWRTIAKASEGAYFQIAQTGGVVAIATPYDDALIKLNGELEKTALAYGDATLKEEMASKRQAQAGISMGAAESTAPASLKAAAADRAVYNQTAAGVSNLWGRQDLVADIVSGKVKLADVKEGDLPDEMKKMTPAERETFIASRTEARKKLQQGIDAASKDRDKFLKAELAKSGAKGDSFDESVIVSFRDQAAKKGIRFERKETPEPKPAAAPSKTLPDAVQPAPK